MPCCGDKVKYERLKDIKLASVMASQIANSTGVAQAVVKQVHHLYGEHYAPMNYNKAKADGLHIFRKYTSDKSMAV